MSMQTYWIPGLAFLPFFCSFLFLSFFLFFFFRGGALRVEVGVVMVSVDGMVVGVSTFAMSVDCGCSQ